MNRLLSLLLILSIAACSPQEQPAAPSTPVADDASGWSLGAMASAANPYAVDAAIEMLEKGGHAVDAAIAAHAVLGLVEPQSSGIGGSGFMLVFERDDKKLAFHDGRETAPAAAAVDMFMRDGEAMSYLEAWQSGLSVGVPGTIALYWSAHEKHGKLPWADLFQPAIRLATDGFEVPPRMGNYLPSMAERGRLDEDPGSAAYFFPDGEPLAVGELTKNPEYANTLTRIANEGPEAFYTGEIAESIVAATKAEPGPGILTMEDMANYRAVVRDAACGSFRDVNICSAAPPSSGAMIAMLSTIYDHLVQDAESQSDRIAAFVDAQRLAYADRDHYFGDPDEIDVPLDELLDPAYLEHRATERFAPGDTPTHGDPAAVLRMDEAAFLFSPDATMEARGTSHLSIIDAEGNAAALTASVGAPFGNHRWVAGFVLNNEVNDFAMAVPADGSRSANAITPGRRPRSSMSPTMVFDASGDLLMVTGSPGGNSIPADTAKTILGVLDWGLSAQEAVDHPNIIARGESVRVEISMEPGPEIADDLQARGYNVRESQGENSGLHVIVVRDNALEGAADKRRDGIVRTVDASSAAAN